MDGQKPSLLFVGGYRDYTEIQYYTEGKNSTSRQLPTYIESGTTSFPHVLRGAQAIFNYRPHEEDIQLQVPHTGTLWILQNSNYSNSPPRIIFDSGGKRLYIDYSKREGKTGWVPSVRYLRCQAASPDNPILILPPSPTVGPQTHVADIFAHEDLHVTVGPISQAMKRRMRFRHGELSPFEHGAIYICLSARTYPPGREVFHEIAVPRIWGSSVAERMTTLDYYREMCGSLEQGRKMSAFPDRNAFQVMALEAADRFLSRHVMWEITEL